MPYTTPDLIRRHLISTYPLQSRVTDHSLVVPDSDWVIFWGGAVDASTCTVKALRTATLTRVAVTLNATATTFAASPVVRGSVTVASDSSLGTIFTESVDFIIDYEQGTISPASSGALLPGQAVTLWYLPYTVLTLGIDFDLDDAHGRLRRHLGGSLVSGATIHVDFTPIFAGVDDDMAASAAGTANALIECEVDPTRQFEADPILGLAATFRALELLCRTAAARELSSLRGQDKVATVWLKLADDYAARSSTLIANFRAPITSPHSPRLS